MLKMEIENSSIYIVLFSSLGFRLLVFSNFSSVVLMEKSLFSLFAIPYFYILNHFLIDEIIKFSFQIQFQPTIISQFIPRKDQNKQQVIPSLKDLTTRLSLLQLEQERVGKLKNHFVNHINLHHPFEVIGILQRYLIEISARLDCFLYLSYC